MGGGYRVREGMGAYLLHRLTGVGVLLFLVLHILDTLLLAWGPAVYNRVIRIYAHPAFRPLEVLLFAAVLFHALNGVRITLVDFWDGAGRYHRQLVWGAVVVFVGLFLPGAWLMLRSLFHSP